MGDPSSSAPGNHDSLLFRAIRVQQGELPGLVGGFLYYFFLLCSYYILRPVRDEMGVRGGVENMQWLFTATFVAMLVAAPLFAALATRFRRTRLIPTAYGIFILCILGFWLWLRSDVAMAWGARTFFVWLSVFNLFVVSVFWSFMADLFDDAQAARLFGAIAAGGSAGAILGPGLTGVLAQQLAPETLLPLAAGILALTLPCMGLLNRWSYRRADGGRQARGEEGPLGGTVLEGIQAIATSRYLLGICAFIWLYTTLATFLYFTQADIVEQAFADSGDRTSVFAAIDFTTNALTVGLQLFVTARLVQRLGLGRALALVPLLVAAGFLMLAMLPGLLVLAAFQVIRRAGNYAIARPGREMLFTVVPRMQKYKSKNAIDTVVYRGGDAIAGWVYAGLAAMGLGITGISLVAVPLALVWAAIGYGLGLSRNARAQQRREEVDHEQAAYAHPP
ncbi:MFS transporter [Aquisalimonas lutea]|uniref:NTP/NDP exchange transporter n=1 Tax=Aquisalimonas lutea TaxID=1327750 RepID=UPI0025B59BA8|nr:MFS transporter [Aquisalimonas lutea]MDN3518100.1 MFS transporter [Aquisalimonas lutea]